MNTLNKIQAVGRALRNTANKNNVMVVPMGMTVPSHAPATGTVIHNNFDNRVYVYTGTEWSRVSEDLMLPIPLYDARHQYFSLQKSDRKYFISIDTYSGKKHRVYTVDEEELREYTASSFHGMLIHIPIFINITRHIK